MKTIISLFLGLLLAFAPLGVAVAGKTVFVTIGTAGEDGIYHPTGTAIAKILNKKRRNYGIRATVESTGGSAHNVRAVLDGDLEFGIVQSDIQFQAVTGKAQWDQEGPQKDLRAVFSIHPEAVTLVASVDSGIIAFSDLRGKRVNIGNPGSGHRENAIDALAVNGLNWKTDISDNQANTREASALLQDRRIDAFFYTVGHPSDILMEAANGAVKVKFIEIPEIDKLIAAHPYYVPARIPATRYPEADNKGDIGTFGVKATLVTSDKLPDEVVYNLTREIFENLDEFKKLQPAFANLSPKSMLEGLSAPIHPGALKYYREAGLK